MLNSKNICRFINFAIAHYGAVGLDKAAAVQVVLQALFGSIKYGIEPIPAVVRNTPTLMGKTLLNSPLILIWAINSGIYPSCVNYWKPSFPKRQPLITMRLNTILLPSAGA